MLALGLASIGFSGWPALWVRTVGLISAAGHAIAATALLFGAEMPTTDAEPSDWAPMVVAIFKLLFWSTLIGWIIALWKSPRPVSDAGRPPGDGADEADHERTVRS